ncbi:hypothetical protein HN51_066086 [Arachis hypogaea]
MIIISTFNLHLEMVAFFVSNKTDTNCSWSIVQLHALRFFISFVSMFHLAFFSKLVT